MKPSEQLTFAQLLAWAASGPTLEAVERERLIAEILRCSGCQITGDGVLLSDLQGDQVLLLERNLSLIDYRTLTELPPGLTIQGSLELNACSALKALPANLFVGKDLRIEACKLLALLPGPLSVGGSLELVACRNLKGLPSDLHVGASIIVHRCEQFESVPAKLSLSGDLSITLCPAIITLGAGLTIHGDLELSGSHAFVELPNDLCLKGNLYLEGCQKITGLPGWALTMGVDASGNGKTVVVEGTGLSPVLINKFNSAFELRDYSYPANATLIMPASANESEPVTNSDAEKASASESIADAVETLSASTL